MEKVVDEQEIPDMSGEESYGCLAALAFLFLGPVLAIFARGLLTKKKKIAMTLSVEATITRCKECLRKYGKVMPYETDYAEYEMKVLVNKDFATEFLIENPNSSARA